MKKRNPVCPVCRHACNADKSDLVICRVCAKTCHANCLEECPHPRRGKNSVLRVRADGKLHRIRFLPKTRLRGLKVLGNAEGNDVYHCLYLAVKYEREFLKRVRGYRTDKPTKKDMKIRVVFYEKAPDANA